jgi:hypothetical protein
MLEMKGFMKIGQVCALVSAIELLFPSIAPMARAGDPPLPPIQYQREPAKLSLDVVINATRELRGAVVNPNRTPSVNAKVVLCMVNTKDTQEVITDATGSFLLKDVSPGLYTVAVNSEKGQTQQIARVWTPETAPPAATPVALVSLQEQPNDGIGGEGVTDPVASGILSGLANRPVLVTGLLLGGAAAIAIPLSVRHHGS